MARLATVYPCSKILLPLAVAGVALGMLHAAAATTFRPARWRRSATTTITKDEFDKWLTTAAKGQAQRRHRVVPDPPDYTKCVAAKKKQPVAEGQPKPSDAALKKQCKQEYDAAQGRGHAVPDPGAMGPAGGREAEHQGHRRRGPEARSQDQKKQAFPTEKAYQSSSRPPA